MDVAKIKPETLLILAGLVGAVALAWYAKGKIVEALPFVNPVDPRNLVNMGANSAYQAVTGSTGSIGTDLYDAFHGGSLDVTSENNMVYRNVGSGNLGNDAYDWLHEKDSLTAKVLGWFE